MAVSLPAYVPQVVKEYYKLSEGKANVNYRDGVLDLSYEMTAARELLPGQEVGTCDRVRGPFLPGTSRC